MKHPYLLALCLLATTLSAQTAGAPTTTYPKPITLNLTPTLPAADLFDLDADHQLRHHYTHDTPGRTHAKYHQYYKGLRVLSGTTVLHLNAEGLYATTGRLGEFSDLSVSGKIDRQAGEQLARLRVAGELGVSPRSNLELTATQRVVANTAYPATNGAYVPAYVYTLVNEGLSVPLNRDVIVNANTGQVIAAIDNIHTTMTTGSGDGFYHDDLTFPVDSISPDRFILQDLTRGKGVYAYDISNSNLPLIDADNDWTEPEDNKAAMLDGYAGSVLFYDFMAEHLDRNSLDDNGVELIANMNRHTYVNAFWNGTSANFGNGDCEDWSALTVYEIVAHEYAHGLTDYTSDLIYYGESGAINEAISDIMGKAFEWHYDREHFIWRIGDRIRRPGNSRYFRSMSNPNLRSHPMFYEGRHWRFDDGDNNGVHSKSGLMNFWFYLLVEGGTDFNEAGYEFNVSPIGMDSALQLVYQLEAAYLTEDSDFRDAYLYTEMAAADLWGANSQAYAAAKEAWLAVGVDENAVPTGGGGEGVTQLSLRARFTDGENFDLCPADLAAMTVTYTNESDTTLPAGVILNGALIFNHFAAGESILDTVPLTAIPLTEDIQPGQTFQLSVAYDYQGEDDFIRVTNQLLFVNAAGNYLFEYSGRSFLFVNQVQEVTLDFSSVELGDACSPDPNAIDDRWYIDLPRCLEPSNGTLRFVYTTADGTVSEVTRSLAGFDRSGYFFSLTAQEANLDAADLNGTRLTVSYADPDGSEIMLYENDFAGYFAETISEPTTETFDDETAARQRLAIAGCAGCAVRFDDNQLTIGDSVRFFDRDDCIPIDDILNRDITQDAPRVSTVRLCVETAGMDNPYLSFDLRQLDPPRTLRRQALYSHIVDVKVDDRSLLAEPISTTGEEMVAQEVRLGDGFSGEIVLYVVSSFTETTIDNLAIVSGSPSRVRDLPTGDYGFRFANPASSRLEVFADRLVPAGTTVTLFAATGQQLRQFPMRGTRAGQTLSGVPAGLYFVTVSDGASFRWTGKLVKQ